MTLSPAYGRDYKSGKDARADFEANKDFVVEDLFGGNAGRMVNKQDLPVGTRVTLRYKNKRQLVVVTVR